MSMGLYVLSDKKPSSMAAWQQAIDSEGFPVRLPLQLPLLQIKGVLKIKFRGRATAFEYAPRDADDVMAEWSQNDFAQRWTCALELLWGGDVYAGISAYVAGAAYAKATGGILLDCEQGKIIPAQRGFEIAMELERSIPLIEAAVRKVAEAFRK